ncbi:SDR family NAD(P)-dependent oxidoreductase [Virgibacillus sp. C22-A2]|uniref:SDR family NAD(P)-dependent oxidoreductase n=1 Tax=Virgibacillus tibetensis TaxID=3042313 RepID=A0ABU6KKE6_9BACI|nr:SDR family NAD(P)-dependent oxidoreductase [Virgibacillus sp. C22-A2]
MERRTVIITGANSGIGKAAAHKFAIEGYCVIMACRNIDISKKVQKEIVEATNNEHVELMRIDMSSFNSIRKFCEEFKSNYEKLDILIHNAAYFNHGEKKYQLSTDNVEVTFATNTFGPLLMTKLLENHLAKSDDPRILHACTNNIRHFFNPKRKIEFDNLRGEYKETRRYSVYKNYGDSKMALLMLTFKMAQVYKEKDIKVNAIEITGAKMSKETIQKVTPKWRVIARVQNLFFPSPDHTANIYFDICTATEYKNVTGKLIGSKKNILRPALTNNPGLITEVKQLFGSEFYPFYATNHDVIQKVWMLSNELVEESEIRSPS